MRGAELRTLFRQQTTAHTWCHSSSQFVLSKRYRKVLYSRAIDNDFAGLVTSPKEKMMAKKRGLETVDDWAERIDGKKQLKYGGLFGRYYQERKRLKTRHRKRLMKANWRKARKEEILELKRRKSQEPSGEGLTGYEENNIINSGGTSIDYDGYSLADSPRQLTLDTSMIMDGRIIYKDENIIAVNKLAGLLTCQSDAGLSGLNRRNAMIYRKRRKRKRAEMKLRRNRKTAKKQLLLTLNQKRNGISKNEDMSDDESAQQSDSDDDDEYDGMNQDDLLNHLRQHIMNDSKMNHEWRELVASNYRNQSAQSSAFTKDRFSTMQDQSKEGPMTAVDLKVGSTPDSLLSQTISPYDSSRFDKYLRSSVSKDEWRLRTVKHQIDGIKERGLRGVQDSHSALELDGHSQRQRVRPYVGKIHRLDKVTSGVVLFARHREATRAFGELFRRRQHISKHYLAVVQGCPKWNRSLGKPDSIHGTLEHMISANTLYPKVKVMSISEYERQQQIGDEIDQSLSKFDGRADTQNGEEPEESSFVEGKLMERGLSKHERLLMPKFKYCKLNYKVLETWDYDGQLYSMLQIQLHTGRKHQIRAQLSYEGYPIVGDERYRIKVPFLKRKEWVEWSQKQYKNDKLRRLAFLGDCSKLVALHAWRLDYKCPLSGKSVVIEAPVPDFWRVRFSDVLMRHTYDHF